jgi:hypothetical protein
MPPEPPVIIDTFPRMSNILKTLSWRMGFGLRMLCELSREPIAREGVDGGSENLAIVDDIFDDGLS